MFTPGIYIWRNTKLALYRSEVWKVTVKSRTSLISLGLPTCGHSLQPV